MTDDFLERIQTIIQTQRRVAESLLRRRHVVACGVGYKIKNGMLTDIPSLVVSVDRKEAPFELSLDDLIPPFIDDVETDVIETGPIHAQSLDRLSVVRPVRPGVSIGHIDGSAGTAGCLVRRQGEVFLLTNNHVAALFNRASIGDSIVQPGPGDGGTPLDTVGILASYVPLMFAPEALLSGGSVATTGQSTQAPSGCASIFRGLLGRAQTVERDPTGVPLNRLDAALVRPANGVNFAANIAGLDTRPTGVGPTVLGDTVVKSGRTTGVTRGRIIQIDVTVDVAYEEGIARFENQVMVTSFSRRGDSGSLVLDEQGRGVGLLFSGSDNVSIFTPLQLVLDKFDAQLITI